MHKDANDRFGLKTFVRPRAKRLSYNPLLVLASGPTDRQQHRKALLPLLSPAQRTRRPSEWNAGKAVTFIVTLAATRSVTLASRAAGMSRKSAYALKARDPAFAEAWNGALAASAAARCQGDKVEEVEPAPVLLSQGDNAVRRASSNSPATRRDADAARRDLLFARLANRRTKSAVLAGLRARP